MIDHLAFSAGDLGVSVPGSPLSTDWDYIVVGGGSAGCVIAARLSENPDRRVLLLEAGSRGLTPRICVPGLLESALTSPALAWKSSGDPDPSLNGREIAWIGGRVLGGSSSINGMVYGRGLPEDYERWVRAGNAGWGWPDILPYFRRAESWSGSPHPARGSAGPLSVRTFQETNMACMAAMDSLVSLGVPYVEDYNIGISEGVGRTQATQNGRWRESAASAYLAPIRQRNNLKVLVGTRALRLRFKNRECLGLSIRSNGDVVNLNSTRETVLCAGAIGTPQLLLLSGVGPEDALAPLDIPVLHELSGVGKNLNDHVNVKLSAFVQHPTYNTQRRGWAAVRSALRFVFDGTGPASSPANHIQAFIKTDPSSRSADVQIQLMAFGFGSPPQERRDGVTAVVSLCHPEIRGRVRLRSRDPDVPPRISIALLEHLEDRERLLRGCRMAHSCLLDGPVRSMGGHIYAPGATDLDDHAWLQFMRDTAALNWHATSTCRMGFGRDDVVDGELRVHGLDRLSIADASIMPSVTSGNTNAVVIAIAERAAEAISLRNA